MEQQQRLPRGIRNNNPLNLRISNNAWLGKVKHNTDGSFEQFVSMTYGIRAAIINIRTIVRRHNGPMTMAELIQIWAPGSDGNNTFAYINKVEELSNIRRHETINYRNKQQMAALVTAMANVENGLACITRDDVLAAYALIYPDGVSNKEGSHPGTNKVANH